MTNRLVVVAVLAAGTVLSAGASCGGGEGTNGLERKSAAEVQQEAAATLRAAASVRVVSEGEIDGQPARIELRMQGGSSSGTVEMAGSSFQLTKVGDDVYLKGDERALTELGVPAETQRSAANKWLKLAPEQVTLLEGFSIDDIAGELTSPESPIEPTVAQETLDGRKVVVITQQNGSKLYVANTGPAYPVRGILKGNTPGQIDFTEYGVDFGIEAPPDAVELGSVTERQWLITIGAVREDIGETYRTVGTEYEQSEMTLLSNTLGSCRRELLQSGSPSVRMQPAYDLVEQACREFDKGAECYDTAATNWNAPAGTAEHQSVNDSLDCGLEVEKAGGQLLADAEIEGYKAASQR